jgi:hypothetical protein
MITIECSCGGQFQILNEEVAPRVSCPHCGANAADLIAQAESLPQLAPATFQIVCTNHADAATHNCMNWQTTLMDCSRPTAFTAALNAAPLPKPLN